MRKHEHRFVVKAAHAQWLLWLCLGLIAASCAHGQGKPMKKYYPPEDIFDATHLEVARAMVAGDMDRVRALCAGLALDAVGRKNMTLLWYAIQSKNYPAVATMIRLGSEPDEQIVQGIGSALDAAFYSKDTSLLQAMLDGGLSPDHRSPKHKLMLQRAIIDGSFEHVRILITRGSSVNLRDTIGGTALYSSITTHQPEIAAYLIQHGAEIGAYTTGGVTIAWAVHSVINRQQPGPLRTKFEQLRDLMIQKGAKWPPDPPEVVRDRMRAQGLKPAVPPGHAK